MVHQLTSQGKLYRPTFYGVKKDTGYIDYDMLADQAQKKNRNLSLLEHLHILEIWILLSLEKLLIV